MALLRRSVLANSFSDLVTVFPVAAGNVTWDHVCLHTSSTNKGHTFVRPSSALNPFNEPPHAALVRRTNPKHTKYFNFIPLIVFSYHRT